MTTDASARIRDSLLESTYVERVLQVTASNVDGTPLVGIRVCLTNVPTLGDLPPVLADFRGRARDVVGDIADVYVEIDVTGARGGPIATEAIVIRSTD